MTLYKWSQTASSDATADSTINWAEGQAPSSVNDSARAMMAATAKYRDDIAGAIVTSGTSTAYTVSSYQGFDTLAHLSGQMIAFTPHATNAATVTLNVDSLGASPLRSSPGVELLAGTIIQGTPYVATYSNSDGAFYLQGFFGSPYLIPLGGMIDYTGATAPNSSFILPQFQALSRTTYATYFALVGTTYGAGDGSTTFNVPDCRGRATVTVDTGVGRITGATLGSSGGAQNVSIAQNQLPNETLGVSGSASVNSTPNNIVQGTVANIALQTGPGTFTIGSTANSLATSGIASTGSISGSTVSINGGVTQQPTPTLPPYLTVNKILRII
jgi:microcystin-dependent protein